MAAGDVFSCVPTSVAAGASLTIQPGAGVEASIHNLYYAGAVEMYYTDGTNSIKFDSDATAGARLGAIFHVTNTKYLQVKNVTAGAILIAYDGIQSK